MLALLQIELIKTLKRRAFWVSVGLFLLFFIPVLAAAFGSGGGSISVQGQKIVSIALPAGWGIMLDLQGMDIASMASLFLPIMACLFAGSEFVYKTARQNVIDGLTREQFFAAKMLFALLLAVTFFLIYILLVGVFGYVLADSAQLGERLVRAADAQMMGGFFVMLIGLGLLATLFGIATRNTGTAIGLFFFYSIVVEQIIPGLLRIKESLRPIADIFHYFPITVFRQIAKPARYDADFFTTKLSGSPAHFDLSTETAWLCAGAYIVVLSLGSYLILKKTDL